MDAAVFPWDSARHFANSTKALEKAFYPGLPVFANWNNFAGRLYVPGPVANNHDKHDPDAGMGTHDWFEYAKLHGTTLLWTEDWFSDAEAYQWSIYCTKLRSAAERRRLDFGGYVVPRTSGDRPDGLVQKILSVVGHGGKAIQYFVFGPEYAFPGNCYSEKPERLAKMAEAHAMIGKAEPVLWPGRMPPPRWPSSRRAAPEMWDAMHAAAVPGHRAVQIQDAATNHANRDTVDYMAEMFDLCLALQHANIPTDFIPEDDLTAAGLRPYRVVYLTEPDIPAEGQRAVADWAAAGGTRRNRVGAAANDRYDQPCDVFSKAIGIAEQPRERLLIANVAGLKIAGKGDGDRGAFTAIGARGKFLDSGPNGDAAKVLAKFDNGSPAVMSRAVGSGRAVCFAWLPGVSYFRSSSRTQDKLPVGFSASIRNWITLPVELANVEIPVRLDRPLVESPMLLSSAGAAITLLNWTGEPIGELKADVRLPFTAHSIESVRRGPIPFHTAAGRATFALPLGAADIIVVRP